MNLSLETVCPVFTALGVSALLGAYLKSRLERKREILKQQQDFKFTRYKCLINLMHAALDFEKHKKALHEHGRRNFQNLEDLMDELESEYINMLLFSDKKTREQVLAFIQKPSHGLLISSALSMRRDLWAS